ncbi:MAG: peptidoglycan-binding protein LysM [Flavobacterium sp.]|nr:peptidoglycan-binding protein LysM [Flavobacterium sp.]
MRSQNRNILVIKKFLFLFILFLGLINAIENPKIPKEISAPMDLALQSKNYVTIPFIQKNFVGFKEALAFKESQGKYRVVNTLGYLGKYQFGTSTLERFKIYNTTSFLHNPELQEQVFIAYCKVNKWILRKDINSSVGKIMNGVKITESGILAAAHLSGAGNVKKYLRSNGLKNLSDAYGTSINSYMKKFSGYDVSFIKGDRKASI